MEPEKKSHGALIGSIIIIIILIIGGIYIWQSKVKNVAKEEQEMQEVPSPITDELNSLDQDINSLDINTELDVVNIE
ncbi:hypothetical protein KKA39_01980 [Patescibacteria group bacterium]|nr:hypothetical protein [Patescibacteria group bacterium]MBU1728053.1 hypothetical protein [Patescibacteria group bacterium]